VLAGTLANNLKEGCTMEYQQYETLILELQDQLQATQDDSRDGRVDRKTLRYVAKRLQAVEQQICIEYNKAE